MSTTRSATINSHQDGELLGLNASSNGRSCEQHECCGKAVKADDVIRFKLAVVEDVLGKALETIKAVLIKDARNFALLGFWAEKLQHCLHNGASTSTSLRRC